VPPYIYVAVWTLSDGHTLQTLTDEPSYNRWIANPEAYAQKRISRWNSPNRATARLSKATGFRVERYERSVDTPSWRGAVRRAVG